MYNKLLTAVLLSVLGGTAGYSQAISGDLVGTIQDSSGAAIPNATVTAINPATNTKATATTNASGGYRLSNLLPGSYTLTASATGFGTSTVNDIPVKLNTTATANITLQVGAVSSSIEVTEAAAILDTTTAQI